jgi:hypothetical protein
LTVEDIYKLIGKKPNTFTTLKDIKIAAKKLGFSAEGYKLKIEQLKTIKGYAIIPVGAVQGSDKDFLHFILLKDIKGGFAKIVNINDFKLQDIPLDDLRNAWKGYALVLSPGEEDTFLRNLKPQPGHDEKGVEIAGSKNFKIVDSGSILEHTFAILNESKQACRLRIMSKTCSCIYPEFGKTELEPKEETYVKLRLHVDKPGWSVVAVTVGLEPTGIIKRFVMRAFGRDSFRTSPETGHIQAPDGDVVAYPVRVTYFTDSNSVVLFDCIDSNVPELSVDTTTLSKIEKGEYAIFNFDVKLLYDAGKPSDTISRYQGDLNFVLNTTKGKRFIPFRMTIKSGRSKYRLTPEKVFLIASKSGKTIEKKVKVELLTESPTTNITTQPDKALPIKIKTSQVSKNTYIISMSVGAEELHHSATGLIKGNINIISQGVNDAPAIKLPVSLFVRQ